MKEHTVEVHTLNYSFCFLFKVDLTAYVEKHEFCFDAVLNEEVTNDEVVALPHVLNNVETLCACM